MYDQSLNDPAIKDRLYQLWTWMQDFGYLDKVRCCAQVHLRIFASSAASTNCTLDDESLVRIAELIDYTLVRIADSDVRHNVPPQGKFDDTLFNRVKITMKEIIEHEQSLQAGRE